MTDDEKKLEEIEQALDPAKDGPWVHSQMSWLLSYAKRLRGQIGIFKEKFVEAEWRRRKAEHRIRCVVGTCDGTTTHAWTDEGWKLGVLEDLNDGPIS